MNMPLALIYNILVPRDSYIRFLSLSLYLKVHSFKKLPKYEANGLYQFKWAQIPKQAHLKYKS